jgi:hypothetical protein
MRAPAGWLAGEEAATGSAALLSLAEHSLLLRAHGASPGGEGMALDAPGPGAGPPLASGLGGPLSAHAGAPASGPWGVVAGVSTMPRPAQPASCAAVSAPAPARTPALRRGSGGGRNAKASSSQYRCGVPAAPGPRLHLAGWQVAERISGTLRVSPVLPPRATCAAAVYMPAAFRSPHMRGGCGLVEEHAPCHHV